MAKDIARKCNQKLLDHDKNSATDAPKFASKGQAEEKKRAEATGDLIGNKMADKIAVVSKKFFETVTNGHDKEIPKKGYISAKQRQQITNDRRLI